jgi:hypothetical protein
LSFENWCKIFFRSYPGWPDWANFRLFGDCLLWAVLLKMTKVAKILGYFIYGKIDINALGYIHFGWLFHELIWSPCSYPQNMIMYSVLRFLYLTCFCQPMYVLKANGI